MDNLNNYSVAGIQLDGESFADELADIIIEKGIVNGVQAGDGLNESTSNNVKTLSVDNTVARRQEDNQFDNVVITGNLTVQGQEHIVEVDTFEVKDAIVLFNKDLTVANPNVDVGFEAREKRDNGSGDEIKVKGIISKAGTDKFTVFTNATQSITSLEQPFNLGSLSVRDAVANDEPATKGQMDTALNLKANLSSPTFTGDVAVPSPSVGTSAVNRDYVENNFTPQTNVGTISFSSSGGDKLDLIGENDGRYSLFIDTNTVGVRTNHTFKVQHQNTDVIRTDTGQNVHIENGDLLMNSNNVSEVDTLQFNNTLQDKILLFGTNADYSIGINDYEVHITTGRLFNLFRQTTPVIQTDQSDNVTIPNGDLLMSNNNVLDVDTLRFNQDTQNKILLYGTDTDYSIGVDTTELYLKTGGQFNIYRGSTPIFQIADDGDVRIPGGSLNMNNNRLIGVPAPLLTNEATNKQYVDDRAFDATANIDFTGDVTFANNLTVNGLLRTDSSPIECGNIFDMNGNRVVACGEPVNPQDVATKNYVDSATGSGSGNSSWGRRYPLTIFGTATNDWQDVETWNTGITLESGKSYIITVTMVATSDKTDLAVGDVIGGQILCQVGAINFTSARTMATMVEDVLLTHRTGGTMVCVRHLTAPSNDVLNITPQLKLKSEPLSNLITTYLINELS